MSHPPPSPIAAGMVWATRISSVGFQFVVPIGIGWYLDELWGTRPAALLGGAFVGLLVGSLSLVQLTKRVMNPPGDRKN